MQSTQDDVSNVKAHMNVLVTMLDRLTCMQKCRISDARVIINHCGSLAEWWHDLGRVLYTRLGGLSFDDEADVFVIPEGIPLGLKRAMFMAFNERRGLILRTRKMPKKSNEILDSAIPALAVLLLDRIVTEGRDG